MNKVYSRIQWENYPSVVTPLNEYNLNLMDSAIDTLDDRTVELETVKAEKSVVLNTINDWTMDPETGVITITKVNGEQIIFDLNIEKIPISFTLSEDGILTMTTDDGTEFVTNIASLIPILTFNNSDQIVVKVETDGINKTYSFEVKDGSITDDKLQTNYLSDIREQTNKASNSESNAKSHMNLARSYSIGTNNTIRENDAMDNAKYYYNQTKQLSQATLGGGLVPMGDVTTINDLPEIITEGENSNIGHLFRITRLFQVDDRFDSNSNKSTYYPASTYVFINTSGKFEILSHNENKYNANASGLYSSANGYRTTASGEGSHAEGSNTTASGQWSHAEGSGTAASSYYAHAEGDGAQANSVGSHAEGYRTITDAKYSHAEGNETVVDFGADYGHAEGWKTTVMGMGAHAEGANTMAFGSYSHAEGCDTEAGGENSHASGLHSAAVAINSFACGNSTWALGVDSFVCGNSNEGNAQNVFQVGIGGFQDGNRSSKMIKIDNQTALVANTPTGICDCDLPLYTSRNVRITGLRGVIRTSLVATNSNAKMSVQVRVSGDYNTQVYDVEALNYYGTFYFTVPDYVPFNVNMSSSVIIVATCNTACNVLNGSTLFLLFERMDGLSVNQNGEISYSGKIKHEYVELYAQNGTFTSTINLNNLNEAGTNLNDFSDLYIAVGNSAKNHIYNMTRIPWDMTLACGGRMAEVRSYVSGTYSRLIIDSPEQIRLQASHAGYCAMLVGVK